jgi:hypothetical protein
MTDQCYYRLFGEEFGPISRDALDAMIDSGQLGDDDEVRLDGESLWQTVRQWTETATAARSATGTAVEGGSVMSLDALDGIDLEAAPQTNGSLASPPAEGWYYQSLGQEWGPYSFEELLEHARRGDLSPDDQIRLGGKGKWRRAGSMGRLMAVMPYQQPAAPSSKPPADEDKNDEDEEFETKVTLRESPPVVAARPAAAPPPPPPPPPPMPAPGYPAYGATYVSQMAPGWGMMTAAPVVDQGWYAWVGGVECGPMEFDQLTNWAQSGRLTAQDYVKQGRYSQWTLAETIPGLIPPSRPVSKPLAAATAPAEPTPAPPATAAAVASTPAGAPAKPQFQLPPPTKSVAPRLKPASLETRPAETKSEFPPDAPPERPPSDWNTSSAVSTYGSGPGTPMASRPSSPPKKFSPPSKGKKKKSGGEINVGALLSDKRVLGGIGVVVLIVLGYFGWGLLPEGTGKLVAAHKEITKIHKEVQDKVAANPAEKDWADFGKQIKKKTADVTKTISSSKHPARTSLSGAASAINFAVGKKSPQEAEERLNDAEKKLEDAKKKLKI